MTGNVQARIAIGVAAGVWFVIALLSHSHDALTLALKTFSLAGTAATLLFLVYDRYIWGWRWVRWFTGKPLLGGTWRGELRSDFRPPGQTEPLAPIKTVFRIKQTNSQVAVTMFTAESESTSQQVDLSKESDDRWHLSWVYRNTPRQSVQHRSQDHEGVCHVYLAGGRGEWLTGQYFTSRKTTGEVELSEWSKHSYGDARSAQAATDFGTAHPFSRA